MAENTGRMSAMPKVKIDDVDDMEERLKQRKNEIIRIRDSLACIDWKKIKMSSIGENVLVELMVEVEPNAKIESLNPAASDVVNDHFRGGMHQPIDELLNPKCYGGVAEEEELKADHPQRSVRISTNSVVDIMSKKTEVLLENFHGDLLKLKRRFNWATVLESEDVDGEGKIAETMMIIQQMDDWVSQSIDKIVTYLVSRTQILNQGVDPMQLLMNPTYKDNDALCQAVQLIDCKIGNDLKAIVDTMYVNYDVLQMSLAASKKDILEEEQEEHECLMNQIYS